MQWTKYFIVGALAALLVSSASLAAVPLNTIVASSLGQVTLYVDGKARFFKDYGRKTPIIARFAQIGA